jgi:hypothetical protein
MKSYLHVLAIVLFVASLLYNVIVWGGVRALPEVGTALADSAHREAPLAATYIAIGGIVDSAMPSLGAFGSARLTDALGDGFEQIRADPAVAMDVTFGTTWNAMHRWLKTMYWSTPVFLLMALVLWVRRPKQVRVLRR